MVVHIANHLLSAPYSHRRLAGDLAGYTHHTFKQGISISIGAIDQANTLRLFALNGATGEGQLTHHAIANNTRQTLQCADVSCHADIDFSDGKLRINR